jgi:hypothetical protein
MFAVPVFKSRQKIANDLLQHVTTEVQHIDQTGTFLKAKRQKRSTCIAGHVATDSRRQNIERVRMAEGQIRALSKGHEFCDRIPMPGVHLLPLQPVCKWQFFVFF